VKVTLALDRPGRDDFFRRSYIDSLESALRIEAAEHTGSLSGDDRKEIETRFKNAKDDLNVLVCTPTMELGVDIGSLSAVYMRNVPPSPANYAQRQGRAGRQAQPSAVVTFCSAQGRSAMHDQYFFQRPSKIIAGKIAAPRFLLDNEALLTAHLNAIILGARDEDFPDTLSAWVALETPNGGLTPHYRATVDAFIADRRAELLAGGMAAFRDVFDAATAVTDALVAVTIDGFADSLHSEMAALVDYYAELSNEHKELNAKSLHEGLERSGQRRREAISAAHVDTPGGRIVRDVLDRLPLHQHLAGTLVAPAGDAGDAIGGIADEREPIRDRSWLDAVLRDHAGLVEELVLPAIPSHDVGADHALTHVLIDGGDPDLLDARIGSGARRGGRDRVVRFEVDHRPHHEPERRGRAFGDLELRE